MNCDLCSAQLWVSLLILYNSNYFFDVGQDTFNILQQQHLHNKSFNECISCKGPKCNLPSEEILN